MRVPVLVQYVNGLQAPRACQICGWHDLGICRKDVRQAWEGRRRYGPRNGVIAGDVSLNWGRSITAPMDFEYGTWRCPGGENSLPGDRANVGYLGFLERR